MVLSFYVLVKSCYYDSLFFNSSSSHVIVVLSFSGARRVMLSDDFIFFRSSSSHAINGSLFFRSSSGHAIIFFLFQEVIESYYLMVLSFLGANRVMLSYGSLFFRNPHAISVPSCQELVESCYHMFFTFHELVES